MKVFHLKILLFITAFTSCSAVAFTQPSEVGVYVTVKKKKKCENEVVSIINEKYCLAPLPVLTKQDFASITEIKLDLANQRYFTLAFTENGATKLRNLAVAFPNNEIVMVIDNLVVGVLTNLELLKSNTLKMTDGGAPGNNVQLVHEKLSALIPVRK
jgi:hypothetical protein